MPKLFFLFIFLISLSGVRTTSSNQRQPALIIFDTDFAEDYDDVGALTCFMRLLTKARLGSLVPFHPTLLKQQYLLLV